jgi:hypothetical protein
MILPLSIEDESLTTGTAPVMHEFASDLDIKIDKSHDYLPYNEQGKKFNINAARERYKFYKKMECHAIDMERLRQQIEAGEDDDIEITDNFRTDRGVDCSASFKVTGHLW